MILALLAGKDTKAHAARTVALDLGTILALREMRLSHVEAALACGAHYPAMRTCGGRTQCRDTDAT